jgi:hypothetical protein
VKPNWKIAAQTACMGAAPGVAPGYAQSPTALEQAELAGLNPEMRVEVQKRAVGGNSVTEVLQVMLLNNIKAKQPANQIIAMDWRKGVTVVQRAAGDMKVVRLAPVTLQIRD